MLDHHLSATEILRLSLTSNTYILHRRFLTVKAKVES